MITETETKITEKDIGANAHELSVTVRHNFDYEYTFNVRFGCQQIYLTIDDIKKIVKVANKALRVTADAHA